jgi:putative flippase GtrA
MSLLAISRKLSPSLRHFAHFVLVGGVNTCFGYLMYAGGVFAGFRPPMALLIATVLGVAFNFVSFGKLVFKRIAWKRTPYFVAIYVVNYLGNTFLLGKVQVLIPSPYLAQAVILPVSVLFLFFMLRRFVFDPHA